MSEFKLPELGENIHGGDVLRVLVKPGDAVKAEAESRQPEAGSREPDAGSGKPEAESRKPPMPRQPEDEIVDAPKPRRGEVVDIGRGPRVAAQGAAAAESSVAPAAAPSVRRI